MIVLKIQFETSLLFLLTIIHWLFTLIEGTKNCPGKSLCEDSKSFSSPIYQWFLEEVSCHDEIETSSWKVFREPGAFLEIITSI